MALRETPRLQRRRARASRAGQDKAAILDSLLTDIERDELAAQTAKKEGIGRLALRFRGREAGLRTGERRLGLIRESFEGGRDIAERGLDIRGAGVRQRADTSLMNLLTEAGLRREGLDIKKKAARRDLPLEFAQIPVAFAGGLAKSRLEERRAKRLERITERVADPQLLSFYPYS